MLVSRLVVLVFVDDVVDEVFTDEDVRDFEDGSGYYETEPYQEVLPIFSGFEVEALVVLFDLEYPFEKIEAARYIQHEQVFGRIFKLVENFGFFFF